MIISKKKYEMAIKEAVDKEINAYDKQRYERDDNERRYRRMNELENRVYNIEKRLGMAHPNNCDYVTSF